jgi:3-hydroxyisobutyrate dehydrogenase-like beta-hydroxyacid dehydrogenase
VPGQLFRTVISNEPEEITVKILSSDPFLLSPELQNQTMGSMEGPQIGFIGLGAMGWHMASHLASKLPNATRIYVFDIVKSLVDKLCEQYGEKIVRCAHAKEVANRSTIIFTMLPEGKHVKAVYLDGADSVCATDISNKILIDCSTIDTASSLFVKEHIKQNFPTTSFYDAPVSGGVVGAQKGTIAFFLGCREDDKNLSQLTDLLRLMGKEIIPCGGPSLGLAAKLSNNYLSGIIAIACSEAMDMGMRSGLDPRVLAKVYAAGTAQNTICDRFNPVPGIHPEAPSTNGYKNGFKVQLMRKDFSLAMEMANRVGSKNVLGDAGLKTYVGTSNDERCRDLDSRVVFRYLGGNENWRDDFKDAAKDSV